MIVQGLGGMLASAYSGIAGSTANATRQSLTVTTANNADRVSISDTARAELAKAQAESAAIEERLAAIKAKPGVERAPGDYEFLLQHDQRYAALVDKIRESGNESLTASEVDYMQKAGGSVNTMAELTTSEQALYDELVSSGQGEAAQAMLLVGMARSGMSGQEVTLPNGKHFDPGNTAITADTLRNLFRLMFVDPSGQTDRQFESLASALEKRETAATVA